MQTTVTNIVQVSPHTAQDAFFNKHKYGYYEIFNKQFVSVCKIRLCFNPLYIKTITFKTDKTK